MGGSVAGPFGAGGGLVLGLIFGLSTADSHYEQLHGQILAEQAKDKELEAQLEQEIELQRELEAQLENRKDTSEPEQRESTAGNRGSESGPAGIGRSSRAQKGACSIRRVNGMSGYGAKPKTQLTSPPGSTHRSPQRKASGTAPSSPHLIDSQYHLSPSQRRPIRRATSSGSISPGKMI